MRFNHIKQNLERDYSIFTQVSELLNMKIIIMSATLPKLSYLASNERYKHLIGDRDKYFKDPIFKDRVQLDFSLLDLDKEKYCLN